LLDPIKALGKAGLLGNFLNRFDGGVEILDDLDDHWTAKDHKDERRVIIEDLQDLAADKSVRITILSGDVHLAAIGQFYSNPKLNLAKHKDFRYMCNVISSAIVNTPPPDLMADVLNKRNKVHHFDKETDENMIPIFSHGVEGKPRNNKNLLPHRNWCSIRAYTPGDTPPHTPDQSAHDLTPMGSPPKGGLLRRLSKSRTMGPSLRPDVSRPPVSGGGFMRSFSRGRASTDSARPGPPKRTMSLTRGDFTPGSLFRRLSGRGKRPPEHEYFPRTARSPRSPDDGGINGQWGVDSDEEEQSLPPAAAKRLGISQHANRKGKAPDPYPVDDDDDVTSEEAAAPPPNVRRDRVGMRGGGAADTPEYEDGDESYFTTKHHPSRPAAPAAASAPDFEPKAFTRTPTGLSTRQMKRAADFEVNVEGALEVTLNVEVSAKDPAGITAPYRLVIPKLWYQYVAEEGGEQIEAFGDRDEPWQEEDVGKSGGAFGGLKRWISNRGTKKGKVKEGEMVHGGPGRGQGEYDSEDDYDEEYEEGMSAGIERK
jgi:hypothetical protein